MNASSLDEFKREIAQIKAYIKHIEFVNDVVSYTIEQTNTEELTSLLNKHQKSNTDILETKKKLFEYKAIIISLYGILERYIKLWIKEYLDALSRLVSDYSQIDEKIREAHFKLSIKLITTINDDKGSSKYQHLTKEDVLDTINNCIVNPTSYKFNTEAFVLSSGNLKHSKIIELLKEPLQLKLDEGLKKNKTFFEYMQNDQQISNIANIPSNVLYFKINDLVERRNIIAHSSQVEDLLDYDILNNYIDFLEHYCEAIFEYFCQEFIRNESIHSFKLIEVVHNVWHQSIIGFEIENYFIKIGDYLIIQTAEDKFYKTPILTIQVENTPYSELEITTKINIGISVAPSINKNCKFYIKINNK